MSGAVVRRSDTPQPGRPRSHGGKAADYDAILAESENVLSLALRALTEQSVEDARWRVAASRHVQADPEVTAKPTIGGGVHTVVSALLQAKLLRLRARTASDAESVARLEYDAAMVRVHMLNGVDGAIRAMREEEHVPVGTRGGRGAATSPPASKAGHRPDSAASGVSGAVPLPDNGGDERPAPSGAGGDGGRGGASHAARPATAATAGLGAGAELAALLDRALDDAEEVVTGVIAVAHVRSSAITLHGGIAGAPPGGAGPAGALA